MTARGGVLWRDGKVCEVEDLRIQREVEHLCYRGTSFIRNNPPVEPYSRPLFKTPKVVLGGLKFLMSEVPLYQGSCFSVQGSAVE